MTTSETNLDRTLTSRSEDPTPSSLALHVRAAELPQPQAPAVVGGTARHSADAIASHELPAAHLSPEISASRAEKIKVSMISLCGCWGCTLSVLDLDERLLAMLDKITILRSSLTDIKRITERCAIGFIEGGVANEENIETLKHFRENCDVLISVGACANWGGVPALRNLVALEDCLSEAYVHSPTAVAGAEPVVPFHAEIPILTTKVYPCHEVVKMDYFIPGCPPSADAIFEVLDDLINGRPVRLPKALNQFD